MADARVLDGPPVTAELASQKLIEATQDLGSIFAGAVSHGDTATGGVVRKMLSNIRFAWHFPARLEGRVVQPGIRPGLPPEEAALMDVLNRIDELLAEAPLLNAGAVVTVLDSVTADLLDAYGGASPTLKRGNFEYPSLRDVRDPDLRDFLSLQIQRVRLARRFAFDIEEAKLTGQYSDRTTGVRQVYEKLLRSGPHFWDGEQGRFPVAPEDQPLLLAREMFDRGFGSRSSVLVYREDLNVEEALKEGTQGELLMPASTEKGPFLNWPIIVSPFPHPSYLAVGYSPDRDQYAVGRVASVEDEEGAKQGYAVGIVWGDEDFNEVFRRLHPGETPDSLATGPSCVAHVIALVSRLMLERARTEHPPVRADAEWEIPLLLYWVACRYLETRVPRVLIEVQGYETLLMRRLVRRFPSMAAVANQRLREFHAALEVTAQEDIRYQLMGAAHVTLLKLGFAAPESYSLRNFPEFVIVELVTLFKLLDGVFGIDDPRRLGPFNPPTLEELAQSRKGPLPSRSGS